MSMNRFQKITGASLLAVGMTVAPLSFEAVNAQESNQNQEAVEQDTSESATQNFEEAEESLEQAGQEAVQGVEAAGQAAEQQLEQAGQEASQAAQAASQEAVQQAETAAQRAENAADSIQQRSNWGWLGLFGLIGLFGLAGGKKQRSEPDERYPRDRSTTTTGEYNPQILKSHFMGCCSDGLDAHPPCPNPDVQALHGNPGSACFITIYLLLFRTATAGVYSYLYIGLCQQAEDVLS